MHGFKKKLEQNNLFRQIWFSLFQKPYPMISMCLYLHRAIVLPREYQLAFSDTPYIFLTFALPILY